MLDKCATFITFLLFLSTKKAINTYFKCISFTTFPKTQTGFYRFPVFTQWLLFPGVPADSDSTDSPLCEPITQRNLHSRQMFKSAFPGH